MFHAIVTPASATWSATRARERLASIDALRGLVIVLMVLDHVREYFTDVRFDPLDLAQTDAPQFLTRWITHFCAPIFVFLAGVSARLVGSRGTREQLSRFLLTRGLWLILLEFTAIEFAFTFNVRYELGLIMQVIWAIGASMVALAGLVYLPVRTIAVLGAVLIAGHNALDGIDPAQLGMWQQLWRILHVHGPISFAYVHYPLLPWIGVMAIGYVAGEVYELDPARRRRILLGAGSAALAAFVALRTTNLYGDPLPWHAQPSGLLTALSFINVTKYPPSLLYVLLMLGVGALLLAALESVRGRLADVVATFGHVPLFAYAAHIALVHLAAGLTALAMGYGTSVLNNIFLFNPDGWGVGLAAVYAIWLAVLVALYPACSWFAQLKRRRSDWWLSYL